MFSYTGEECIVCRQKFTDKDDIVSCPECGTPYHRSCWNEKGECVNYALHESGSSWMAESGKTNKAAVSGVRKVCPDCSFINSEDASQCRNCGAELENRECRTIDLSDQKVVRIELDADADYFGMNPMEIMDESTGITIGEMADYAKHNKLFYMLTFRRLKNSAVKFSLNLIAFLFPEIYFAGRKMYLQALIVFLVRFLLGIPLNIFKCANMSEIMSESFPLYMVPKETAELMKNFEQFWTEHSFSQSVINFTYALGIAVNVVIGLFANELYFRHTLKKLKKLRKTVPDYLKYRNVIKTCGGISIVGILGAIAVQLLMALMLSVMLFIISFGI